ncbi:major facilitator superfamily [Scheffersomyces amazonensis]|uniref:major facilitator superfamily n=1 Tax=Scheffersomyces amazonensis TaxID=1078765 RepID=UPI00315DBAE7
MSTTYTIKEQLEGFPLFQMIIIGTLRLSEPIAFTSMFPYIYFMIRSFGIAKNEADTSRYSGYLASSFAFSQFISTVQWAKLSNKYGRKTILLLGCLGTALSMLVFGFSSNFYMAMFARSLMGLLNGNVSIIRTTVGEIAHEKRHQALAFSNLTLLWSLGRCVGGWLGGFLTDTDKLNLSTHAGANDESGKRSGATPNTPFFDKHPFAFSNIIVACILSCFITIGFLFLEETHEDYKDKRDIGLEIGDVIRKRLGFQVPDRPWKTQRYTNDFEQAEHLIEDDETTENVELQQFSYDEEGNKKEHIHEDFNMKKENSEESTTSTDSTTSSSASSTNESLHDTFSNLPTQVVHIISNDFMIKFSNIIYAEFFPVFLAKVVMPDDLKFPFRIRGGFGWNSDAIGWLLSFTGLLGVFVVSFLFPVITRFFPPRIAYRIGLICYPFIYVSIPLYIFTIPKYNSSIPPIVSKVLLYFTACLTSFSSSLTASQGIILIHRASPKRQRALINSYNMSIAALSRCAGPILWGWIIAHFEIMGYEGFSWWLLGIFSLAAFFYSFKLTGEEYEE